MLTAPLISVIVATRNRPQLLERALTSICSQSFENFEVLVIDDGSTAEVRNSYGPVWSKLDERFRLILLGPDDHFGNGPSKARNFGIRQARGDFLAFCDDDDHWISDDHLAIFAKALEARADMRLYIANQTGFRNGVLKVADWLPQVTARLSQRPRLPDSPVYEIPADDLVASSAFPHLNITIVQKATAVGIGGFWEKVSYEEDLDFFWRCLDRVDYVLFRPDIVSRHNIPDPLAHDNISTQINWEERLIAQSLICCHTAAQVRSPAIVRKAGRRHADALRHFVRTQEKKGNLYPAARIAIAALLARFSMKWLGYTGYLSLKDTIHSHRGQTALPEPHAAESPLPTDERPFFSVIVPTRNRWQVVTKALMEIRAQTFRDFEVIVVDDGSSEEVRAGYAELWRGLDGRFRLLPFGPADHRGNGPSRARNHGIAAARGRFVAFCDDDDHWCDPQHLAIAARAIEKDPATQMFVANQIGFLDGEEKVKDWLPDLSDRLAGRTPVEGNDVYRISQADLIAARTFPHLNILIVRRDIVDAVGGFWERAPYEGDLDFFWRCLDKVDHALFRAAITSLHNIPDPNAHRNVSTQSSKQERWLLRVANCDHILAAIRTGALARRVFVLKGDTLRHLSLDLTQSGHRTAGLFLSLQALAARFSLKWAGYVVSLLLRETLAGGKP